MVVENIYFFCATHGLKAFQNAILSDARTMKDEDGNKVNYDDLYDLLTEDQKNVTQRTRLSEKNLNIERWTKMNVSIAKTTVEYKIILELFILICRRLHLSNDLISSLKEAAKEKSNPFVLKKGTFYEGVIFTAAIEFQKSACEGMMARKKISS